MKNGELAECTGVIWQRNQAVLVQMHLHKSREVCEACWKGAQEVAVKVEICQTSQSAKRVWQAAQLVVVHKQPPQRRKVAKKSSGNPVHSHLVISIVVNPPQTSITDTGRDPIDSQLLICNLPSCLLRIHFIWLALFGQV